MNERMGPHSLGPSVCPVVPPWLTHFSHEATVTSVRAGRYPLDGEQGSGSEQKAPACEADVGPSRPSRQLTPRRWALSGPPHGAPAKAVVSGHRLAEPNSQDDPGPGGDGAAVHEPGAPLARPPSLWL